MHMEKFNRRPPVNKKKKPRLQSSQQNHADLQRQQICDLAARLVFEDGIRDYQKAKHRACDILGIRGNTFLPANEEIELALQTRQRLFGSETGEEKSMQQLDAARNILQILRAYQARLSGSLAEGRIMRDLPIEIHAFCNAIELVCDELNWRGIPTWTSEKRYRYSNQSYTRVPLIACEFDDNSVEVSIFGEKELHRLPICPTNGRAYKRISLDRLQHSPVTPASYSPAMA